MTWGGESEGVAVMAGWVEIDLLGLLGVCWTAPALGVLTVSRGKGLEVELGRLGCGFLFRIGKHIGWSSSCSSPQVYEESHVGHLKKYVIARYACNLRLKGGPDKYILIGRLAMGIIVLGPRTC